MPGFAEIVNTLRGQKQQLEAELQRVNTAITALQGISGGARRGRPKGATPAAAKRSRVRKKGYKLSAATRAKMRAGQQARWAKAKK